MPAPVDRSGITYGRLTAIIRVEGGKWRCICECGNETVVGGGHLSCGITKSCGCLQREKAGEKTRIRNTKHGCSSRGKITPAYKAWVSMIKRCHPKARCRKNYKERGISICVRWRNFFESFLEDMGERPKDRYTLERIDNSLGYSKENCRWATMKEQQRNRRNNHLVTIDGETLCVSEWAERVGTKVSTIQKRLLKGWNERDAVLTLARGWKRSDESL